MLTLTLTLTKFARRRADGDWQVVDHATVRARVRVSPNP